MRTELLHQTLSPQAHAALFDTLRQQAERDRRDTVQRFGQAWAERFGARFRGIAARRALGAPAIPLMEG